MKDQKTKEQVIAAIPTDKKNAVHQWEIARKLNISETKVKLAIKEARKQGIYILSDRCGYWLSNDREEIAQFVKATEKQGLSRFSVTKNMRQSLKTGEGQLSMDQFGVTPEAGTPITAGRRDPAAGVFPGSSRAPAGPCYDYSNLQYVFVEKRTGRLLDSETARKNQGFPTCGVKENGKIVIYDRFPKSQGTIAGNHWERNGGHYGI